MKKSVGLLLVLFGAAFVLRLRWIIPTGFNGLYGQDAYAYYNFAFELRDALMEWRVPEPFFWPLGYPILLMIVYTVSGVGAWIGQTVSVVMGTLLAPLMYIIMRQMGCGRVGAFVSGLLMVVCGQAVQSCIVMMSDIPALFWAMLSAVCLIYYVQSPTDSQRLPRFILIIAAVLLTIAGLTRWLYFVLAPLWTLVVIFHWRGKIRWWDSVGVVVVVLLMLLPQYVYSQTNPYPTINHSFVVGWSPSNALQKSFTPADQYYADAYSNARYYAAPLLNPYYLAPLFIPLAVLGLWYLFQNVMPRYLITLIVGWMLVPYLFLIGIPSQNIRFPLVMFPPIAICVGFGMHAVWIFLHCHNAERMSRQIQAGRIMLIVIVAIGIGHTLNVSEATIGSFIETQQQDKTIAHKLQERLPPDSTLYTFGLTLTLQHETTFIVYDLYYEGQHTLDEKWIRGQHDYVLVNVWVINNLWEGREPHTALYWLLRERGLLRIGRYGNYTLFRIRG